MFFWDPMYLVFALPALLLAFYAQARVQGAYRKYTRVANSRGVTGLQAAKYLLDSVGLSFLNIEGTPGELSDHYDPRSKTLRLSPAVARQPSVASLSIVAHEIGHALQDAEGYAPLRIRSGLVPAVTVGSWVGPILFVVGLLMASPTLAWAGVVAFAGAAVFALVTLPVEFNASRRGLALLRQSGLLTTEAELKGAKAVLDAAALTYVAALAQSLSTLLYYIFLLSGMRRED
ncbi:MAG: zinc metallopeptidase [Anaerolineae bacterium]|nr:zinc metallopeptidase [Anaerolineae bacterium]